MAKSGWQAYFYSHVKPSSGMSSTPHMQANLWAAFLWAAQATKVDLFKQRVYDATRRLMTLYPGTRLVLTALN
jgi:hypothetical protein